ncbi:MAG: T9SS type A sorting domain-containing protein, partial [Prolixibacteraceae bacterium]
TLHSFGHPVFWLANDPNNAERMYASVVHFGGTQGSQSGGIYMTNNLSSGASSVWTKLPNPPRTEGHPACMLVLNDGKMVCTFSGRRTSTGFTASSGVFLYNPTTNSWSDVSNTGMQYWTKDIVLDPSDPAQNTWYACVFSGWGGAPNGLGGLYKTIDRGKNWIKLTGSQFDRVSSLTFNPLDPNQAYLTTETQGLWRSVNMNAATPTWTLVDSYPFRQPERVFFNPFNNEEMWVTSFGNGMKVGTSLTVGINEVILNRTDITVYPNPIAETTYFTNNDPINTIVQVNVYDLDGRLLIEKTIGPNSINTASLSPGIYLLEFILKDHSRVYRKVVK